MWPDSFLNENQDTFYVGYFLLTRQMKINVLLDGEFRAKQCGAGSPWNPSSGRGPHPSQRCGTSLEVLEHPEAGLLGPGQGPPPWASPFSKEGSDGPPTGLLG